MARGCLCWVISGMIANVLISKPIQAKSQWLLDTVKIVPKARLVKSEAKRS